MQGYGEEPDSRGRQGDLISDLLRLIGEGGSGGRQVRVLK